MLSLILSSSLSESLSLSFSHGAETHIPAPPFLLAAYILVWSLVRNWRGEPAPRRIDHLSIVTSCFDSRETLAKSVHDIICGQDEDMCVSKDSKVRRICNWLSSCTQKLLINVSVSEWCMVSGGVLWGSLRTWSLPSQPFFLGLRLETAAESMLSKLQMVQS